MLADYQILTGIGSPYSRLGTSTRDNCCAAPPNDGNNGPHRIFTWPWGGHGSQAGFSYGSSVVGVDGNNPTTFLWEAGGENHALPYTEVYIRSLAGGGDGPSNDVIKTGTGTVTLAAANTYTGETRVEAGTLDVADNDALGSDDAGVVVTDGGTLGLSGGVTISDEPIQLDGTGAAGQPGALVGLSGNNSVAASSPISADVVSLGEIGIGSATAGDTLTIDADIDLMLSKLTVDGVGDTLVNGVIGGNGADLPGATFEDVVLGMNPVAYYTFDDVAGTTIANDGSLTLQTAELVGGATITNSGRHGNGVAIAENSGQVVQVDNGVGPIDLPADRAWTIAGWFQDLHDTSDWRTFARGQAGDHHVIVESGSWRFGMFDNTRGGGFRHSGYNADGSTSPTLDIRSGTGWHYVVAVGNSNDTTDFYIDNTFLGTSDRSSNTDVWRIGSWPNQTFASVLDDFAVYDSSLSTGEIQSLWDARDGLTPLFASNALMKMGTGTLTLTNDNAYNDGTMILEGTLLANNTTGSATGPAPVDVHGGTLGGDGLVGGTVNVANGGSVAPGQVTPSVGALTTADVTFEDVSNYGAEITSSGNDVLNVTGAVALNNADLATTLETGYQPIDQQQFLIVDNDGADAVSGTFENLAEGDTFELNNGSTNRLFSISYVAGDGNDIVLTHINRPPVVVDGGPYVINEGGGLTLDATSTVDPDGDPLTFSWDINGDGTFGDATGANPTLTLAELEAIDIDLNDGPGTFNVTVRVNDGELEVDSTTTLDITNVPPTAVIDGPSATIPNYAVPFDLSALNEPGPQDQAAGFTYSVDWGDGTPVENIGPETATTIIQTHEFEVGPADLADFIAGNLSYLVTLTVSDKDGGTTSASQTIAVVPVAVVDNVLQIGGTDGVNDRIIVSESGADGQGNPEYMVRYNDIRFPRSSGTGYSAAEFSLVQIVGGGGNDYITMSGRCLATVIDAGEGNDVVNGGTCDDSINGGPGRDMILTGEGDNSVDGGDGNDFIAARAGNDILRGGSGNDRIIAGNGGDLLDGGSGNDQLSADGGMDLLIGGSGNDILNGGSGRDVMVGNDGNDILRGGGQEDIGIGGDGKDGIIGDGGGDLLIGGHSSNEENETALLQLLADWGFGLNTSNLGAVTDDDGTTDALAGEGGADTLYVGPNDRLNSVRPNDTLINIS